MRGEWGCHFSIGFTEHRETGNVTEKYLCQGIHRTFEILPKHIGAFDTEVLDFLCLIR